MAKIPKVLQPHIDTAFPAHVCLVGSVLPNGFAQITPRGGTMVYDDEHHRAVGARQGFDQRQSDGRHEADGLFPQAAIARGGHSAERRHRPVLRQRDRSTNPGPVYEEVWRRLVQPEKDRDPNKAGYAVLIRIERAEDLDGAPLNLE